MDEKRAANAPVAVGQSGQDVWVPRILAGIAGTPLILGTLKTLMEAGAGRPFDLGDVAYYVGWAGLAAVVGLLPAAIAGGFVAWLANDVLKAQGDDAAAYAAVAVWIGWVLLMTFTGLTEGSPDEDSSATVFRLIGIATVAGGAAAYAGYKASRTPKL